MGLDMYLKAKRFAAGYEHNRPAERATYKAILDATGLAGVAAADTPHAEVSVCVIYWRKANAIHRWFVQNVQNGTDDCGEYELSPEKLKALRNVCAEVLAVAKVSDGQPVHAGTTFKAGGEVEQHFEIGRAILNGQEIQKILPTQDGFFFGSTAYDEWYLRDVEDTIHEIDRVLAALPDGVWLTYRSSW